VVNNPDSFSTVEACLDSPGGRGTACYEMEQHNRQVRQSLRKRLLGFKTKEFEDPVGVLPVKMRFEDIVVTGRSGSA